MYLLFLCLIFFYLRRKRWLLFHSNTRGGFSLKKQKQKQNKTKGELCSWLTVDLDGIATPYHNEHLPGKLSPSTHMGNGSVSRRWHVHISTKQEKVAADMLSRSDRLGSYRYLFTFFPFFFFFLPTLFRPIIRPAGCFPYPIVLFLFGSASVNPWCDTIMQTFLIFILNNHAWFMSTLLSLSLIIIIIQSIRHARPQTVGSKPLPPAVTLMLRRLEKYGWLPS